MRNLAFATLLTFSLAPAACGGDDDDGGGGNTTDAATPTADSAPGTPDATPGPDAPPPTDASVCAVDLNPIADGSDIDENQLPDIVISEIAPDEFIEVFNTTDADIDVSMSPHASYQWCQKPAYPFLDRIVIPARGYAVMDWPVSFAGTRASGELQIYRNNGFGNGSNILDYVCWGTLPAENRNGEADSVNKWLDGTDCAPAIPSGGSLARRVGVAGTSADDYEILATPSPEICRGQ